MPRKPNPLRAFRRNDAGSITSLSLVLLVPLLMMAGYAIDFSNGMKARTQLQIAADAAAHAALMTRELNSESDAKAAALNVAELNMPADRYGFVIENDDIVFGEFNQDTFTFTPKAGSRKAVQVTARRVGERANALQTHLLKLAGVDEIDLITGAVFVTYYPSCLREGFVAEARVDLQSNNVYTNGFCIHSNSHVELNSNNFFEPGTVVSMSDLNDLELPNSGYATNAGLEQALREGSWNIKIIERVDNIIAGLKAFDPMYLPKYITSNIAVPLPNKTVSQSHLQSGRLHTFTCSGGGGDLTISNDVVVSKAVIVTNCDIKFGSGVRLEDAVIATTSTGSKSMSATAGFQIGKNDNCATGGDAQLVTMGSMDFPSQLQVYNGQLLAVQNILFSALANGIKGAAFVAGGEISGTSNMEMGFCGTGMENNFMAEYFRLAL